MRAIITRKYYLHLDKISIKQLMQSAEFSDNEWEDEEEVELFLSCMSEDDLKEYLDDWTSDIEIEEQ